MKKLLLSVIALYTFSLVNAQDEILVNPILSKKGENYLPEMDDWAISFNADGIFEYIGNAFNGTLDNRAPGVDYIRSNTFVGKKFISDKKAYRVVANLGFNNNSRTSISSGLEPANANKEVKTNAFDVALGLGKEWRKGNTRLQGFYGADVLLTANSSNSETTFNAISDGEFIQSTENKSGLGLGLGIQGFLGAEYFIFPKFAIGAQYTYRVGFDIQGNSETTTTVGTADPVTSDNGKSSSFGLGNVGIASINLTLHF
ncbi:hypothetical protein LXD69_09770 [Flavobacterium sediminilitoris]|uniref:Outer membrane protein beta-barrel domain-containing protein n=1 Tax=Flavobacterium sediminilitoris TaxID=2024526 RepID=A0ABY4HHM5_9FLAO|nr:MULTISPECIES: hypothetical protein [Flavobacterium]UOX32338.1 hypothetical protein LXD69_09770 [Flavobacterium sediminilitoris]